MDYRYIKFKPPTNWAFKTLRCMECEGHGEVKDPDGVVTPDPDLPEWLQPKVAWKTCPACNGEGRVPNPDYKAD